MYLKIKKLMGKIKKLIINHNFFSIKKLLIILKKKFKIIYKFNISNKKILFLDNNQKFITFFQLINKKLNNQLFIPSNLWLNGLLSNFFVFKYLCLRYKKIYKFLFFLVLKINIDLIVCFNNKIKNEFRKLKIPIVYFNFNFKKKFKITNVYYLIFQILKKQ